MTPKISAKAAKKAGKAQKSIQKGIKKLRKKNLDSCAKKINEFLKRRCPDYGSVGYRAQRLVDMFAYSIAFELPSWPSNIILEEIRDEFRLDLAYWIAEIVISEGI